MVWASGPGCKNKVHFLRGWVFDEWEACGNFRRSTLIEPILVNFNDRMAWDGKGFRARRFRRCVPYLSADVGRSTGGHC